MSQMVSFKDYEGMSGFGLSSQNEVDDLNKALSTGYGLASNSAGAATTVGGTLRVESLEATLRVVTWTLQNIKFWRKIPKLPAFSTVEEYNLLSDYGGEGNPFTAEGELPPTADSTYTRKTALVKFIGTTREVTHPATLVRPAHGNVIALETQNGAIWLVERLERALFGARSDTIPLAFDGVDRQILDGVGLTDPFVASPFANQPTLIDCRGGALTEDLLEQAANAVVENYGVPTDLYLAPRAMSELAKQFYPRERINMPAPVAGQIGFAVSSFQSSAGLLEFNSDIFLRPGGNNGRKTPPATAQGGDTTHAVPAAPTSATATPTGTDAPNFTAADAGAYFYRVTQINQYGESAATDSASISVTATQHVPLVITKNGTPTGFRIYRTAVGAAVGTAQFVAEVPAAAGATTTWTDYNNFLPGAGKAYLFQNNVNNFSFRQLAPMMKIPLATVAASIRWMQLLYGTPIVYTPKKNAIFFNVKDA